MTAKKSAASPWEAAYESQTRRAVWRDNSNLAAAGANARGRNAAFPSLRPVRGISVGARRAASRPCVSSSVDVPVLKDSAPAGVGMDRAGIGMPSRYPPAVHILFRA